VHQGALRVLMHGVEPSRIARADDDPGPVHDVDVVPQAAHHLVDNRLRHR
jgi:hypothetical protein